jgi:AcrR family transcriptional regulator
MAAVLTRAERQRQNREQLVDAAERMFSKQGFHATSIDAIAAEAGFTKGAVYSNFTSKEDLFFAVYERRVDRRVEEMEDAIRGATSTADALARLAPTAGRRQPTDDGWLAVFFEFWAHVLRHPELRERFAQQHRRVIEPLAAAAKDGYELATAHYAMQLGLQLERLTQPDVVDADFGRRLGLAFMEGSRNGLQD